MPVLNQTSLYHFEVLDDHEQQRLGVVERVPMLGFIASNDRERVGVFSTVKQAVTALVEEHHG